MYCAEDYLAIFPLQHSLLTKNTQRKNRKETITLRTRQTLQKYSQKKKKKKVIIEQVKLDKQMFLSW